MLEAIDNRYLKPPISVSILQIGGLQIAFPQSQIAHISLVDDMNSRVSDNSNVGWIISDKKTWPIYALSESLSILSSALRQSRFCVCFHPIDGQHYLGLIVDAIATIELDDTFIVQPIPDCMYNPSSPVTQIFESNGRLVYISDVSDLFRYIDVLELQQ